MLLLPRNWASSSLNPPLFGAFLLVGTSLGLVVFSRGILEGLRYSMSCSLNPSKPAQLLLPLTRSRLSSLMSSPLMCWRWSLSCRRCCLATRGPSESCLVLFLLFFFLSFFTGTLTHCRRFLKQKLGIFKMFLVQTSLCTVSALILQGMCFMCKDALPLKESVHPRTDWRFSLYSTLLRLHSTILDFESFLNQFYMGQKFPDEKDRRC